MEPKTSVRAEEGRRSILTSDRPPRGRDRYWLHGLLFVLTLLSTVFAGGQLAGRVLRYAEGEVWFTVLGQLPIGPAFLLDGLLFGLSLLLFLTVHEFGHYFAARRHRVDTSLPYYIPLPPFVGFGTLGAVIRIREPIPTTRKLFDIGAAGPIAGFVVALALLLYALATLPPPTYLLDQAGHEALKAFIEEYGRFPEGRVGGRPGETLVIGQTLLYWGLSQLFPHVPPMYEMYHYPVLFASWLGLFFTALNLLPVGQLDGGHILYALVGPKWHALLARTFVLLLLTSGAVGYVTDAAPYMQDYHASAGLLSWIILAAILYFYLDRIFQGNLRLVAPALLGIVLLSVLARAVGPVATQFGYIGWLVFSLLIVVLIKVDHPPVLYPERLSPARRVLALLSILIFLLCFSFRPIYVV